MPLKRAVLVVPVLLFALAIPACGGFGDGERKIVAEGTKLDPAAVANITYKTDKNQNTQVRLEVDHLAPPQRLGPNYSSYVVWVAPPEGEFEPSGALTVGRDRSGTMVFVTPLKQFRIKITAEQDPTTRAPSDNVVLQTNVDASY